MLYINAIALSLLVAAAGIFLLAKAKKDELGKFYRFCSWFLIIGGIVLILGTVQMGIIRCVKHCMKDGGCMQHKEIRKIMMNDDGEPMMDIMMERGDGDNKFFFKKGCGEDMMPSCQKKCMKMSCPGGHNGMNEERTDTVIITDKPGQQIPK